MSKRVRIVFTKHVVIHQPKIRTAQNVVVTAGDIDTSIDSEAILTVRQPEVRAATPLISSGNVDTSPNLPTLVVLTQPNVSVFSSALMPIGKIDESIRFDSLLPIAPPITRAAPAIAILPCHIDEFGNFAMDVPFIEQIDFGLHATTIRDRFSALKATFSTIDPLILPAIVSDEDFEEWFLQSQIEIVSLLELLSPVDLFQRSYADRYWKKLPGENVEKKKTRTRRKKNSPDDPQQEPKAETESKSTHRAISMWDLLFSILSPSPLLPNAEQVNIPFALYPYQKPGIEFLISNPTALLADDMGTGKTIMSIVAMRRLFQLGSIRRVLIVSPLNVLFQWQEKINEWASDLAEYTVLVRHPDREQRNMLWKQPALVYLTTYETLSSDSLGRKKSKNAKKNEVKPAVSEIPPFDLLIVDEAHRISNQSSNRFEAVSTVGKRAKYRWALTGTPIQNSIQELIALFQFLRPQDNVLNKQTTVEAARNYIEPHFLRRTKQEVLKDLPEKIHEDEWIELSDEQREEYEDAELGIRQELENLGENATDFQFRSTVNRSLQRLKQICNFASGTYSSPKTELLKSQIEDIVRNHAKALVFSQYIDEGVDKLVKVLEASGYGCVVIKGGQSDKDRRQAVDDFKNREAIQVLIGSVKAAGEGLNLTEANYVVHFDHWWTPAAMRQAEDRAHRAGQKKTVSVYSYWTLDTVDARIRSILKRKEALFGAIFDGLTEGEIDTQFTRDEWYEIFGMKIKQDKPASSPTNVETKISDKSEALKTFGQDTPVAEIKERLLQLSPREFEDFVCGILKYRGYSNAKVVGQSGDGGIDILANSKQGRVVAQCKRYKDIITPNIARDFRGAMDDKHAQIGLLITTGDFTKECRNFCIRNRIEAIDGNQLATFVKRHGLKI